MLSDLIGRLNAACARRAPLVALLFTLICVGCVTLSMTCLSVTTDTGKMFSSSLIWRKQLQEMNRLFPQDDNQLVAIIDGRIPEQGRAAARQLTDILSQDHHHFKIVSLPGGDPFYSNHAFLFPDKKNTETLLNSIITAQPFLGTLAGDPSARGLFNSLALIGEGIKAGQGVPDAFDNTLKGFSNSLANSASGHPQDLSWQNLLTGNISDLGSRYQFVVTQPVLDYNSLQPGEAATTAMRQAINSLDLVKSGQVSGTITGQIKLNDEEFSTVAHGMALGLVISLTLVSLWLVLAVKSIRVILPILLTLISGLIITTGFAAIAVQELNLISISFAILFVGIAVDFAIQYSVRFLGQDFPTKTHHLSLQKAITQTGRESGVQILIASLATAAGFLAFTPTNFIGVAQLGLIAGFGMLIAFVCTMTLLPALLSLFRAKLGVHEAGFPALLPLDQQIRHKRKKILGVFGLLAIVGAALLPLLSFDADPLHTKDPNTEGMKALHLLEESPLTTPYFSQVLVPNLTEAQKEADAFSKLPSVHDVLWLGALVPDDQKEKIALIKDAASIILPTITLDHVASAPTTADIRSSAEKAAAQLDSVQDRLSPTLNQIRLTLHKLSTSSDDTLNKTNIALTRFLPEQLSMLRAALNPQPITIGNIPASIRKDYVLPNGEERLTIHPKGQASNTQVLHKFVNELRTVNTNVTGPVIDIFESAHTIVHAFIVAAISALTMILIILFATFRRVLDTCLVMAPLILSSLLTVILIIAVPETLNYANIIALPLLLGVGVSFNVYFVMNWRAGIRNPLTSSTARAVLFSALTTATAFGSLALSGHPGTASMGRLLLMSLGCTLICTLLFVPALLPKRSIDKL
ncbi:MMPL family transporter [Swingsia samuiensis]|uniref:RND transporter n=1 Tax=Swingsia samuiensis TaxID=1293412 RepID=A0A4Y6UK35_9PROT|nr:MMPL family transporter [Swingsia samuiensis]QDH16836.1 RND transporter [Swingsia samuiensis]